MSLQFKKLLLPMLVALAGQCAAVSGRDGDIGVMQEFLSTNTLVDFCQQMGGEDWSVPMIHSQWYVDRMSNGVSRDASQQARDFGRLCAERLTIAAAEVNTEDSNATLLTNLIALTKLGNWFAKVNGYGNLMLAWRAHDIASVALAKIVGDLACPTTAIYGAASLLEQDCFTPETCAAVLNEEAGGPVFLVQSNQAVGPAEWLGWTFDCGKALVTRSKTKETLSDLHLTSVPVNTDAMRGHLEFFEEDDYLACDRTVEGLWDRKWHRKITQLTGFQERLNDIKSLLLFRTVIGSFPTSPPPGNWPFTDNVENAFYAAWEPHKSPDNYLVYSSAASVYRRLRSGEYRDEDSVSTRRRRQDQP